MGGGGEAVEGASLAAARIHEYTERVKPMSLRKQGQVVVTESSANLVEIVHTIILTTH